MKKLILISSLFLSTTAFASEDPYSECLDKAGVTNDGVMDICAEKASEIYKKSINKSYNAIFAYYQKNDQKKSKPFEDAQKAWLANRNKNCEIHENKQQCLLQFNQQRAYELEEKQRSVEIKATNESLDSYYDDCLSANNQGEVGATAVTSFCLDDTVSVYQDAITQIYKKFKFVFNEDLLKYNQTNFSKFIKSKCYFLTQGSYGMEVDLCQMNELKAHLEFLQKALKGTY